VSMCDGPSKRAILSRIPSILTELEASIRSKFCRVSALTGLAGGGIESAGADDDGVWPCPTDLGVSPPNDDPWLVLVMPSLRRDCCCLCLCCSWSAYSSCRNSAILLISLSFSILCSKKESNKAAFRVGYGRAIMKNPLQTDCTDEGSICGASEMCGWP
jgi:hypothetical protein